MIDARHLPPFLHVLDWSCINMRVYTHIFVFFAVPQQRRPSRNTYACTYHANSNLVLSPLPSKGFSIEINAAPAAMLNFLGIVLSLAKI